MTREEQILEYANSFKGKGMESDELKEIIRLAIIDGAKWADNHPMKPSLPSNLDEAAEKYDMIATTVEQSKKLLEFGLNPESADMLYQCVGFTIHGTKGYKDFKYRLRTPEDTEYNHTKEFDVPAWSLSALLDIMPKTINQIYHLYLGKFWYEREDKDEFFIDYCELLERGTNYLTGISGKTPLDAAFNTMVWLLEKKYIKFDIE